MSARQMKSSVKIGSALTGVEVIGRKVLKRATSGEEVLTVKVSTMWEIHSYHLRVPCSSCGDEYEFERAMIGEWTPARRTDRVRSRCVGCGDVVETEFDVTNLNRDEDDLDRMLAKTWRPAAGGPYPMGENRFPKFSPKGITSFSIMSRWQLLGAARGSMGQVYLCAHQDDPRSLAIAKLPIGPGHNESHVRECQLLLLLNFGRRSPHVVRLQEVDARPGGVPVFLLESVLPGRRGCVSLADWISAFRKEVDVLPAHQWIGQIATGLIHCGELVDGFAHADLKPDNILVAQGWLCKIADFGLAGWRECPATPGAPLYQAPELADGVIPNASSDVFSLGVIAYELFTGRTPWEKSSKSSLGRLQAAMRSGVVNPDPRVPEIVLRCLDVDFAKRPALQELQEEFMCPEVRKSLIDTSENGFSLASQGLIGLGMPGAVVKMLAASAAQRNTATRINIAIALSQTGEVELAEKQYAALAEEGVDVAQPRAINDQRRGLFGQSLTTLMKLIDLTPTDVGLRISASAAANELGQHRDALEILRPAWKADPGNPSVLYQRAYTLIALRRCSVAKAAVARYTAVAGKSKLSDSLLEKIRACCPGLYK